MIHGAAPGERQPGMNLKAFVAELLDDWREHDCQDIDGADFQEMVIKHGLCVERPATKEEAESDSAAGWDTEEGDVILALVPEMAAMLASEAEAS